MQLKYSDVNWAEFRATTEQWRSLRVTDSITRYVFSLTEAETMSVADAFYLLLEVPVPDFVLSSDRIRLSYSAGVVEAALPAEFFSILHSTKMLDTAPPVEVVSVLYRSPFAEALLSSDLIRCDFRLVVRDVVGYNETFFFGGRFNVDVNNIVFPNDVLSSLMDSGLPDVASVNEVVRVGLRYMLDFYFGGFTFGSVAFGGKIR